MPRFSPAISGLIPTGQGRDLYGLNGLPMIEVAKRTLRAGESEIEHWDRLRPVVSALIDKVQACVESPNFDDSDAADLLGKCAKTMQMLQQVSQGFMKATEGMTRLAMMVEGPKVERPDPKRMTEKAMASLVVETVKKMAKDTGICPVCTKTLEIQGEN